MILVVDNYDSFVHNLARLVRLAGEETRVIRNDRIDPDGVRRLAPEAVVLSPGPGAPGGAGCSVDLVKELSGELPILGVCLGHQAIVEALGGRIARTSEPLHGRTSVVKHNGARLFRDAPNPLTVCRYHSLVADPDQMPAELTVTARADDGAVMAVSHSQLPLHGVQFHPESILTEAGDRLIVNFLQEARAPLTAR